MQNLGVSMTSFELAPCAVRQPHIHQYASGMLYVIQGAWRGNMAMACAWDKSWGLHWRKSSRDGLPPPVETHPSLLLSKPIPSLFLSKSAPPSLSPAPPHS